jgi:hypothetical protein
MDMSEYLGFESPVGYAKIEAGKTNLRLDHFLAICKKLDIDPLKTEEKGKGEELMISVKDGSHLLQLVAEIMRENSAQLEESIRKVIREEIKKDEKK